MYKQKIKAMGSKLLDNLGLDSICGCIVFSLIISVCLAIILRGG